MPGHRNPPVRSGGKAPVGSLGERSLPEAEAVYKQWVTLLFG